ncbi:MAG: hypothetical protein IPL86_19095 [Flavobacteriales bacterium]|nr:hypothetical protein [Flavobacteriales bacterium]
MRQRIGLLQADVQEKDQQQNVEHDGEDHPRALVVPLLMDREAAHSFFSSLISDYRFISHQ